MTTKPTMKLSILTRDPARFRFLGIWRFDGTSLSGSVALMKQTGFDYDGAVYALIWNGKPTLREKSIREAKVCA